jgi:hypothetical protein
VPEGLVLISLAEMLVLTQAAVVVVGLTTTSTTKVATVGPELLFFVMKRFQFMSKQI